VTTDLEVRSLLEPPEFRSQGDKLVASGVAMRYGVKSTPIPGRKGQPPVFREEFRPGALARTIQQADIRSHNEHFGPYLARTANGTLRFTETRSEVAYELDLPDTTAGRDAAALLERGDIRGSSIGFQAIPKTVKWSVDEDGVALRSIGEARMSLCDLTVAPVYTDSTASLALRSLADERHMELRSLLEAAQRGELPTLLASDPEDEDTEQPPVGSDDARETTVIVRPGISALLI
jgi:HK97 family phage prohead protease